MGDIPHGWACAEFMLLLRDILFFEAGEDCATPHIYIAPGVLSHWVGNGENVEVQNAPTIFGNTFGYRLTHDAVHNTITIHILQQLPVALNVALVYSCQFGNTIQSINVDGLNIAAPLNGTTVWLPANAQQATIAYA